MRDARRAHLAAHVEVRVQLAAGRVWRAYLSAVAADGKPIHARDRIGAGPWHNQKGALIAANVADLHGDIIRDRNQINKANALTEKGQPVNGVGDTPIPLKVRIVVEGDDLTVDYSHMPPEVRGAINIVDVKSGVGSTLDYTLASSGTVEAKILDASGGTIADLVLGAQNAGPHTLDNGAQPDRVPLPIQLGVATISAWPMLVRTVRSFS